MKKVVGSSHSISYVNMPQLHPWTYGTMLVVKNSEISFEIMDILPECGKNIENSYCSIVTY